MIELKHVRKEYGDVIPLKDINATINDGDIISIIGPSGTGKSTLIRMINLLEYPTSGDIIVDGYNTVSGEIKPEEVRKKIGMVFQGFHLYPHLTVIENIMVPQMDILKRSKQEAFDKAAELLKRVGLYDKMNNYPDSLSGGQKQRIAIARTLAMDTDVILFDEPTSALDPKMVDEVEYVIKELSKTGKTMMIVTHEMRFAKEVANRVFFMCEGIIYEDGTPEQIFDHPQKPKTIEFINRINRFELEINSKHFDFPQAVMSIGMFADKNRMDYAKINALQLLFEEVTTRLIIPKMPEDFKIKVSISSSDVSGKTHLNFFYNELKNPLEDNITEDDKLSVAIIRNKAESIEIVESEDQAYQHKMRIIL